MKGRAFDTLAEVFQRVAVKSPSPSPREDDLGLKLLAAFHLSSGDEIASASVGDLHEEKHACETKSEAIHPGMPETSPAAHVDDPASPQLDIEAQRAKQRAEMKQRIERARKRKEEEAANEEAAKAERIRCELAASFDSLPSKQPVIVKLPTAARETQHLPTLDGLRCLLSHRSLPES